MKDYSINTDEELIREYQLSKNPYFLEIIIFRHSDACFRIAMRYMRNHSDAEDVLQLIFIQFIQNLHQLREGTTTVKPWLIEITLNACLGKIREEKQRNQRQRKVASQRILQYEGSSSISENQDDREELKKKVLHQVEKLPEKYRAPILLTLYEGFSYPEVASVLALPEKTIRTQVSRGLDRLRKSIASFGPLLSVSLIHELISKTKLETTPPHIKEIFKSTEFYQKTISHTNKLIQKPNQYEFNISKYILWSLPALSLLVLAFFLYVKNFSFESDSSSNKTPFYLAYNYNQPTLNTPYLFSGNAQISGNSGVKGTGCLDLYKSLIFKFPIKRTQLPLKISFNIKIKKENEVFDFGCFWSDWDRLGRFTIAENKIIAPLGLARSNWSQMTIWVTEASIDTWINNDLGRKRLNLDIIDLLIKENRNLYIQLPKNTKIDNLVIETTQTSNIPSTADFFKINTEIFKNSSTKVTALEKYSNKINIKNAFHLKLGKTTETDLSSYFDSLEK